MKTIVPLSKHWLFMAIMFSLLTTIGCKKSSNEDPEFGCDTQVVLETLTNTPGTLVYNPTQAEWQVSIDLGGGKIFSCIFCDKSAYAAKVAGQSTSSSIPVTISGSVKRRIYNQAAIMPTTGYVEVYVLTTTSVN